MKIVIDIDQKSLDWLRALMTNSYNNTRKGVVSSNLFDSIPHIEAWHAALQNPEEIKETAIVEAAPAPKETKPLTARQKAQQAKQREKEKKAQAVYACSIHKSYHGQRSPRSDCDECWELYAIRNGISQASIKRAAFRKKQARQG